MGILNTVRTIEVGIGLGLVLATPVAAYYWFTPPYLVGIYAWTSGVLFAVGFKLLLK